jgi:hypothetical protein
MHRIIGGLIAACLVAVAGCGGTSTTPGAVSLTSVSASSSSGFTAETTIVVTDQATWQSVWQQVNQGTSPVPALPAIDFAQEVVVVAAMGVQPTSGYALTFGSVSEDGGVVTVDVTMSSPGSRCLTLQMVTSPVRVARLARRAGRGIPTVRFRITRRTTDC